MIVKIFLLNIIIFVFFHELRGHILSSPQKITSFFSRSTNISPRIIGGNTMTLHSHKYLVRVISHRKKGKFFCGGTLIHSRCVVTAGHCVNKSKYLEVTMGIYNISASDEEEPYRQTVKSYNFKMHDGYNETLAVNDIAIIFFEKPVMFNDYIQPINLPSATDTKQMYIGNYASAVGWGLTNFGKLIGPSDVPREVSVLVIPNMFCTLKFGSFVRPNNICTNGFTFPFGKAVSTCNGDSGGPLIFEKTNTLIGVTSFGDYQCGDGAPSVYSDVLYFRPWLISNLPR